MNLHNWKEGFMNSRRNPFFRFTFTLFVTVLYKRRRQKNYVAMKLLAANELHFAIYKYPHLVIPYSCNHIDLTSITYIVRLTIATTKCFIINQYFTIEYLFPATCFGLLRPSSCSDTRIHLESFNC